MIRVRPAGRSDVGTVATLVRALLCELSGQPASSAAIPDLTQVTESLLGEDVGVWAFLAIDAKDEAIGVLTLNECAAIYASGKFGQISEFYVKPTSRSGRVGALLIEAAAAFGRDRAWGRLEVGAPSVPKWSRTVKFYTGNGFEEVGPRLRLRL